MLINAFSRVGTDNYKKSLCNQSIMVITENSFHFHCAVAVPLLLLLSTIIKHATILAANKYNVSIKFRQVIFVLQIDYPKRQLVSKTKIIFSFKINKLIHIVHIVSSF